MDPAGDRVQQALYYKYYKPDIPYTHGKFDYTAAFGYGFGAVEKYEFKGQRTLNADEYVEFSGTHCNHIVIPKPVRSEFFRGLKDAVLGTSKTNKYTILFESDLVHKKWLVGSKKV